MINDFDKRQIKILKDQIQQLERKEVHLSNFVSRQWALLDLLQSTDPTWKDEYYALVCQIEDVYATRVADGIQSLTTEDAQIIHGLVIKMKSMLNSI